MSLRFRQTFTLFPGVRLNIGKRGISASIGVPGATVNVGKKGLRATVGLPGTGLSYTTPTLPYDDGHSVTNPLIPSSTEPHLGLTESFPSNTPSNAKIYMPMAGMNEISSASVEVLTSSSLLPLRDLMAKAREQRAEIKSDLQEALAEESKQKNELVRRKSSLFRWFYRRRIAELETELPVTQAEISRLVSWEDSTKIAITFESSDASQRAYAAMVRAFDMLKSSVKKWDITADKATDQFAERTLATRSVNRHPVTFDFSSTDLIQFTGRAMRFENVNGDDILLYPGVAVIPRADGAFALIDLRELQISSEYRRFHEEEGVPSDSRIDGHTWAKTNKNGSPDRRFKDNYQIPICIYGNITFHSQTGVTEEYMVSNADAAQAFAEAVKRYQTSLAESEALMKA
ncbi:MULTISPECIES: DUF4236 domain-containing protein [Klebsiella/Raoultella group]|jgi:hypothetical protein|uniref:DUF4236 domain-containing protein n=1 Tax=Klebsiella/Raoultella group TaxID=2890311 RepID=UPI00103416B6|nr:MULTISPECIES: DUF4236 domain-containing protein [Klebsiella/Raoultella group]MCE9899725.1 DUF4236 domain-containing protein [Raoultella terrigena]MRT51957.1 DUF4236 domain-containing protein [Raoultella sp. RIT712]QIJ47847.1 DUF4236 domain-containing protein [Raoultella ornithinolytica]CAE7064141.1 hypothetical protein AI2699V1_1293 [Klebsiella oxytoca]CAH3676979.1 hypothetical protein AI2699V1_1293 [Klebsiella oxytoca]